MTSTTVRTSTSRASTGAGPFGSLPEAGLLTPGEVAALYRVDARTVTRWADTGRLRCVRTLGGHRRFPVEQFTEHVQALHARSPIRP